MGERGGERKPGGQPGHAGAGRELSPDGEQKPFGETGLALTGRLVKAWPSFQHHHDRRRLPRELQPIQQELRTLLDQAGRKGSYTRHHRVFANKLLKIWPALGTHTRIDGVEPTNNAAERALRGPVIQHKLSHGSQSEPGERFIERALSVPVTCRLQHRSLHTYRPNSSQPTPAATPSPRSPKSLSR